MCIYLEHTHARAPGPSDEVYPNNEESTSHFLFLHRGYGSVGRCERVWASRIYKQQLSLPLPLYTPLAPL